MQVFWPPTPPLNANTINHINFALTDLYALGSPAISAPRVESHLHQKQGRPKVLSTSPRPVSEPTAIDYADMEGSHSREVSKTTSRSSKMHEKLIITPLPAIIDIKNENIPEKLSPNFPTDAPPPPPSIESIPNTLN